MSEIQKPAALGMGNALVDILMPVENDQILFELDLPKGSMTLVDEVKAKTILQRTAGLEKSYASGGSAANTIHGIASMGMSSGYIGSIGKDDLGKTFRNSMESRGVQMYLNHAPVSTGYAITFITPDGERTFGTYLGAATHLKPEYLPTENFPAYSLLHVEGYLIIEYDLLHKTLDMAKKSGLKVSYDLASYNVVEANREQTQTILENYVDIIFANEEEATAFTGKPPGEALDELARLCDIAVVKLGKDGSMANHENEIFSVPAVPADPLDTTGAGDLYASGFIYGFLKGFTPEQCLKTGSLLAGKVIEVMGSKLGEDNWKQIHDGISQILED
ncbi:MAG: adenosine kinase [Chlorobi bacterium]|nr:adenosine kinase [Chlorobiota bacterium]